MLRAGIHSSVGGIFRSRLPLSLCLQVLSKLATLVRELDRRFNERTAELKREMIERQRLAREIVQVADRERRRLGQDLHDRLGQHLIGTGLSAQALKEKLAEQSTPQAADAERLVHYLQEAIDLIVQKIAAVDSRAFIYVKSFGRQISR